MSPLWGSRECCERFSTHMSPLWGFVGWIHLSYTKVSILLELDPLEKQTVSSPENPKIL